MPRTKQKPAPMVAVLSAIVSHPVRFKAYIALCERTASSTELMHEFGLPQVGRVSFHVKELWKAGIVEIVDERPVRGALELFYRAIVRPMADEDEWAAMTQEEREAFSRYALQLIVADLAQAVDAGTFDSRLKRTLARFPMVVDEEGFEELFEIERETLERRFEVQARSAKRMAALERNGEKPKRIPMMSMALLFETPARS